MWPGCKQNISEYTHPTSNPKFKKALYFLLYLYIENPLFVCLMRQNFILLYQGSFNYFLKRVYVDTKVRSYKGQDKHEVTVCLTVWDFIWSILFLSRNLTFSYKLDLHIIRNYSWLFSINLEELCTFFAIVNIWRPVQPY